MSRDRLHKVLFVILLIVGSIAIYHMVENGQWVDVLTHVLSIIGTILTLEVTKKENDNA